MKPKIFQKQNQSLLRGSEVYPDDMASEIAYMHKELDSPSEKDWIVPLVLVCLLFTFILILAVTK